jgi:hypothetical protein
LNRENDGIYAVAPCGWAQGCAHFRDWLARRPKLEAKQQLKAAFFFQSCLDILQPKVINTKRGQFTRDKP